MKKYRTKYPLIQFDVVSKNGSVYPKEALKDIVGKSVPLDIDFNHKKTIGTAIVNDDLTVSVEYNEDIDFDKFIVVSSGTANRKFIDDEQYIVEDFKLKGCHIVPKEKAIWEYN